MLFQISPGQAKEKITKREQIVDKEEELLLSLAPFSKNPKLSFENVLVGTAEIRKLTIENPSNEDVKLHINNNVPEALNFHLSWNNKIIPSQCKEILELFWQPLVQINCRYSITFEIGRRVVKTVPVVLKSIQTKELKQTKSKKKLAYRTSPPIKSPRRKTPTKKIAPPATFTIHKQEKNEFVVIKSPLKFRNTYTVNEILPLIKVESPSKTEQTPINTEKTKYLNILPLKNVMQSTPLFVLNNQEDISLASYACGQGYNNQITERKSLMDCNISSYFNKMSPLQLSNTPIEFKCKLDTLDLSWSSGSSKYSPTSSPQPGPSGLKTIYEKNDSQSFHKRKSPFSKTSPRQKTVLATKRRKDWSVMSGRHVKPSKSISGLKLLGVNENFLSDSNTIIIENPYILAATSTIDPFMSGLFSSKWINQQEIYFKKWLNSLLTPPAELRASVDDKPVDVAKVWQECKNREVALPLTKETVSNRYHTNSKLKSLRKAARNLYKQPEINAVLTKVFQAIDNERLSMRQDKEFHLNVALKAELIKLIFSYNPLWLRIGLETIYNQTILLSSNSDIHGLTTFLMERLFKDPHLFRKYKSVYVTKYITELKKFFLKKFLSLVYFLDQAKNRRLILHDPCLFCRNSEIKESRTLLIRLSQEVLAAVGDITKYLKMFGYVVSHKQMFIQEFNYAVNNLGIDLRDGVRLVRIMEIILVENGLTSQLRVPANSRLQKVYNMKIVFESLEKVGYKIQCDIEPKDIVEGHKEKTLSFLWQIIYKFQAPLMIQKATTIQMWYRSLPVVLKRRHLERDRMRKEAAATKIQSFYKKVIQRRIYKKIHRTITSFQSYAKGWLIRNHYLKRISAVIILQKNVRMFLIKKRYIQYRETAILIQRKFRAQKLMILDRNNFIKQRTASIVIQKWYRSVKEMAVTRQMLQQLKSVAIFIQQKWRSNKLCKEHKMKYDKLKKSTLIIQQRFRAQKLMIQQYNLFILLRKATIKIQNWYRSIKQKNHYNNLKLATIFIQRKYRTILLGRRERSHFLKLKENVLMIQRRFRSQKTMRLERKNYLLLKSSSIKIQSHFRALMQMRKNRTYYLELKTQTIFVQNKFRGNHLCKKQRFYYQALRKATIVIQRRFRAQQLMRLQRNYYQKLRSSTIIIQKWYRSITETRKERTFFLTKKHAVVVIESRYLAQKQMKNDYNNYKELKKVTIFVQRRFRDLSTVKRDRNIFLKKRKAIILIQRYAKGFLVRRKYEEYFTPEAREQRRIARERNAATIKIQSYWRGYQRRCRNTPRLQRLCLRLKEVNALVTMNGKLGRRSEKAISILRSNSTIVQITGALEDLEFATRRCATICENTASYIPEQMYIMLSASNRSLPELKVCILATKILINICKYPITKDSSFIPENIDSLFTLMLHCCDKDELLFPALCTLIWLFAHNHQWKNCILKLPNIHQQLLKINQLCKRKDLMVQRSQQKNMSSVFGITNKPMYMPTLLPDWGLEYEHKPNMFTNSVHAINCVVNILNN